jgi:hydrogenase/urease accessory protein HupE
MSIARPSQPWVQLESDRGSLAVAADFTRQGIVHILYGVDHLLFVFGLLLLVPGRWMLVKTITAFTVAHSITLAGATLGFLQAPGPPIEAVIALSIVFIAAEIVHGRQGRPGLTERFPWIVAFTFGLLHGFGFAGALSEVGLPRAAIPAALLFFNLGVEAGQLAFVALSLSILRVARLVGHRNGMTGPVWAWRLPPYAIGGIASFWLIQRIVNL